MQKEQKTALIWFRNDLRTVDNTSLFEADRQFERLIAVYCFDPMHFAVTPYGFKKTERYRARFLIESITELQTSLASLNISLIVHFDKPESVIPRLVLEHSVSAIFCQEEWTREESDILDKIKEQIPTQCNIYQTFDQFLYHPDDCPIAIGKIPRVFTIFRKSCEKQATIRSETKTVSTKARENLITDIGEIPSLEDLGYKTFEADSRSAFPFRGGEQTALKRLEDYFFKTKKLGYYKKTRNGLLGVDYSSKFSPWLAHGCISARTIYWAVKRFEQKHYKNQSTYWLIFELIWRDFFKYVSMRYGDKIFKIGGILEKSYTWDTSLDRFKEWANGLTPEPFVNANMIELNETGWMSNRGRQNVASYLTRNMNIDWRIGAAYFESLLIDYDVHSNYGNWMYVSGVGNDPRDRKFNVRLQAERYDPQSKFQNLWLQKTLF